MGSLEGDPLSPEQISETSPPIIETEAADSTLGSPTTSRAIDMMDLDPNTLDEPYDSGFLQSSAPIPIRFIINIQIILYKIIFTCFLYLIIFFLLFTVREL